MTDDTSAKQIFHFIKTKRSAFWEGERHRRTLALFHEAAERVPAYKDFLRKWRVDAKKIKTWDDFQSVPPVSKKDYLRNYPLEKLCWDGTLNKQLVFTATSGSTGEPFYFPRSERLDWESSLAHQMFLENSSRGMKATTLVIVCFGMGVWIGGILTYKAFEIAAKRGNYPVSIITPGINKGEIYKALKFLAPQYSEVILAGYPPFIKDLIDEAPEHDIDLKALRLRILFAAESFSEKFREYIAARTGIKDVHRDTLNVYGTADLGTMAYETPIAIFLRRVAINNPALFKATFSYGGKVPTLASYNPMFTNFDALGGEVLVTGNNAVPLIRYAIGDQGGIYSFAEIEAIYKKQGIDLRREAAQARVPINELPMVYIYERKDLSLKFYGAIIYPEHIKAALQNRLVINKVSGKFRMELEFDKENNQHLGINVEVARGVKSARSMKKLLEKLILNSLIENNAEFRNNYLSMAHKVTPHVILRDNDDQAYFQVGGKQQWVKKAV